MNERPSNPFDPAYLDHEAASWLIKRDRGFSPTEQDAFLQWLAADPRHGEWFARHQVTWRQLNQLAEWRPEHSPEPNPDLLARPARPRRGWLRRRVLVPAAMALAACVAVVFTLRHFSPAEPALFVATCEKHTLDDGSVVELNRDARIEVFYTARERRVKLIQGEALFTVAKNPERPFVVDAAGVMVRAIGTAFNVRLEGGRVEVLVTKGLVQVEPHRSPSFAVVAAPQPVATPTVALAETFVAAGHHAVVSTEVTPVPAQVREVTPEQIETLLAWQPRLLDFDSTPLHEVIDAFNRHNNVRLVLADAALADMPIVASIRSDNIEGFVRLLELAAGVRADRHDTTLTLRSTR